MQHGDITVTSFPRPPDKQHAVWQTDTLIIECMSFTTINPLLVNTLMHIALTCDSKTCVCLCTETDVCVRVCVHTMPLCVPRARRVKVLVHANRRVCACVCVHAMPLCCAHVHTSRTDHTSWSARLLTVTIHETNQAIKGDLRPFEVLHKTARGSHEVTMSHALDTQIPYQTHLGSAPAMSSDH